MTQFHLWWEQAIVMSTSVCLSVCLSVCVLSLREHIFGTTHPIFTTFVAHVNHGGGSVLLRRRCDNIRISSFMEGGLVAEWLAC